jgi:uncharacterized membrane protein (DUF106 family)
MVSFLSPVLDPLLRLPPLVVLIIISFLITLIVTIVYKLMTDQKKMKEMKEQIKDYQKKMKETKDTKKMLDIQKKAMDVNMQYMMQSMRPTLITFIPLIFVFAWLNTSMGYYPLQPNTNFNVTVYFNQGVEGPVFLTSTPSLETKNSEVNINNGQAVWFLKGEEGDYLLEFKFHNETYQKDILITKERQYKDPILLLKKSSAQKIVVGNKAVHPFGKYHLFSWYPGWLGTYILLSLLFSFLVRKIMNVY